MLFYELKESKNHPGDWIAGAVDHESGLVYVVAFSGFDAERCAREYVAWKNSGSVNGIPADAICFFRDGDQFCAVRGDFVNLQESNAGFGFTIAQAERELNLQEQDAGPNAG
jgi:hypothetical protein